MKKKIGSFILSLVLLFSYIPNTQAAVFTHDDTVEVMFVGDLESGKVFYRKQDERILPVASMSKLMTYLVVMDNIEKNKISMDDIVEIGKEAASYNLPGYSRLNLKEGEKISVKDLLKGLMIVSGNDASTALAIHTSGSVDKFVEEMNNKSKELGLNNSNFVNPTGLTIYSKDEKSGNSNEGEETKEENIKEESKKSEDKMNTMTAEDLFKLSSHIIKKYPEVQEYGKVKKLEMPERNYSKETTLPLTEKESLMGLKTGHTDEAGYCFTGLFDLSKEENGFDSKIITVVMGADDPQQRALTTSELIKYVTSQYSIREELNKDVPVVDIYDDTTSQGYIELYPERSFKKLMENETLINIEYEIDESKEAPYEAGEVLGKLKLYENGEEVDTINLINRSFVPKQNFIGNIWNSIQNFFDSILLLI